MTRLLQLTRGDCLAEPRPCARRCPYRLDGAESCALDVADRGGASQYDVSRLLRLSETRIQQIERDAVAKLALGLGHPVPALSDYATTTTRVQSEGTLEARDAAVLAFVTARGPVTLDAICAAVSLSRPPVAAALLRLETSDDVVRVERRDGSTRTYFYSAVPTENEEE